MNILVQLKNQNTFSHNEKTIANYILEHPYDILDMNTKELAEVCFVSPATIYRLCDKLKLKGFSSLKVKVSHSIHEYESNDDVFNFDFPVKENQTHYEIIQQLKKDYEQTISSTEQLFDLDMIRQVVHALKKAECIDIYTSAGNIFFAENFQFQMSEIGVKVNVPIEDYKQRLLAASSNSKHIAIIISFEGRNNLAEKLPVILKENKTPIVLISSSNYDDNVINANYHLYLSPKENHYKKISSFSTRLSLLYILDVIYSCYFKLDYKKNIDTKLEYYNKLISIDEK